MKAARRSLRYACHGVDATGWPRRTAPLLQQRE